MELELWNKVLEKLELQISTISFDLWIKPLEVIDFKNYQKIVLCASSTAAKNRIMQNHYTNLSEAIKDVFGDNITFEVLDQNEKIEYLKNVKDDKPTKPLQPEVKGVFNAKYTFDNFVVGKSNQFVYAAARSVAENPGQKFNPLFIYGGAGLGKTHLLHAIGNYLNQFAPDLKVIYVTCEKFTNDYIESLRSNKENETMEFREKYRNVDVLMIDDIQFISNKTSTQEEFFHTFNELYQSNKQIIISSDRPPKEIATLAERLSSRLSCGLIQDIQSPDFETRMAILRKKSQQERYLIEDDVIEYIAEHVDTNIREMEGYLSKVYFFATLLGKKVATLDEAREAIKVTETKKQEDVTPEIIIECVCDYFGISKADISGKKKSKDIVEPRMMAIYLISELIDMPLISIGKHFGGRDHTTIIHARDKITDQVKNNEKTKTIVRELKNLIKNYKR